MAGGSDMAPYDEAALVAGLTLLQVADNPEAWTLFWRAVDLARKAYCAEREELDAWRTGLDGPPDAVGG